MVIASIIVALGALLVSAVGERDTLDRQPDSLLARDSARAAELASCRVEIETLTVTDGTVEDTLDIMLSSVGVSPAGAVLKIGLDAQVLGILKILPGEIVDSCRWEMFSAVQVPLVDPERSPRELWQITALAQTLTDTASPPCLKFDRPASLARIVVSSTHMMSVPDTTAEIFFYWEDCRDNALSDSDGRSILISDTVFSTLPEQFVTGADTPTRHGAPASCVSPRAFIKPRRIVEFGNGGVEFRFDFESSEDSARN